MAIRKFPFIDFDTNDEYEIEYEHDFQPLPSYWEQDIEELNRHGVISIRWAWDDIIIRMLDNTSGLPSHLPSPDTIRKILASMESNHDCNYGLSWSTIDYYLENLDADDLLPIVAKKLVKKSSKDS